MKSKIMIFRNGGKIGKNEKFWFRKEIIEVVQTYKYLGVILTANLSLSEHFEKKVAEASITIHSFNKILYDDNVPLLSKFYLFNTVARTSLCYLWGAGLGCECIQFAGDPTEGFFEESF